MKNNNWRKKLKSFVQGLFPKSSETFVEQIINEESDLKVSGLDVLESNDEYCMGETFEKIVTDIQNNEIRDTSFVSALGEAVSAAINADSNDNLDEFVGSESNSQSPESSILGIENSTPSELPTSNADLFFKELAMLIDELDAVLAQNSISNVVETVKFCQDRIIEIMLRNGGTAINVDNGFDVAKHRTVPFKIVEQGATINHVIRHGVSLNGLTIVKAIVEIA